MTANRFGRHYYHYSHNRFVWIITTTYTPLTTPTSSWTPPWHNCNTRFIKEHKPSNHIRARIKSHVYTTEWTVYHSTYHVKRYNKANMNVIYYINENVLYRVSGSVKKTYTRSSRKQGATGTSTGRRTPRSPRSPGSAERTPSCRQELSSSSISERKK